VLFSIFGHEADFSWRDGEPVADKGLVVGIQLRYRCSNGRRGCPRHPHLPFQSGTGNTLI